MATMWRMFCYFIKKRSKGIPLQSGNHPIGGTEVQIGKEGTAACYSRPQYQAIKVFTLQVPICNEQERRLHPLPSAASWLHLPLCGRDR